LHCNQFYASPATSDHRPLLSEPHVFGGGAGADLTRIATMPLKLN
jgi:hypothetical protein